uniref:PA2c domain-containing protein n=1 Tax=Globodera pallida TaxID=36090 RepID=A0A183BX96_GLOPA
MAKCHLGHSIAIYNGYGCWCAVDAVIAKPLDGIDECCKIHEKCYQNSACKNMLQKYMFYPYNWTCDGLNYKVYEKVRQDKIYVSPPENRSTIKCTSVNVGCKRDMCNCDKAVVECFAKYAKPECKKVCPTTKKSY